MFGKLDGFLSDYDETICLLLIGLENMMLFMIRLDIL